MPRNILVTEVNHDGDNVMVFTELEAPVLAAALTHREFPFTDCVEVRDDELPFYLFEPLWLTPRQEELCRRFATA